MTDDLPAPPLAKPNHSKSASTAFARQVQTLTYAWNRLSPGDVARVLADLLEEADCAPVQGNVLRLERALAIASCLFTGRRLSQLVSAHWTSLVRWPTDHQVKTGLVRCAESWGWYLPAGKVGKPPPGQSFHEEVDADRRLWLPAPPLVEKLAKLSLSARGILGHGNVLLFETDAAMLEVQARDFLTHETTRRAGTTLEAVERWLFDAIRLMPAGDAGLAQILTTRAEITSITASHYTSCDQEGVEDAWWLAAGSLAGGVQRRAPDLRLRKRRYGSVFCPSDDAMRVLAARLKAGLLQSQGEEERHNALTLYTFALCSVGLVLRPANRLILQWNGVDPETGFTVIDDDRRRDPFMVRLGWAAPAVQRQLEHYQFHLSSLASRRTDVASVVHDARPFIPISQFDDGHLRVLTPHDIMTRVCRITPDPLKPNFGRHFVRSKMLGRCATETLQSFLGHWNNGTEPFGTGSGLDPLQYRADLERQLPSILESVGWQALS